MINADKGKVELEGYPAQFRAEFVSIIRALLQTGDIHNRADLELLCNLAFLNADEIQKLIKDKERICKEIATSEETSDTFFDVFSDLL